MGAGKLAAAPTQLAPGCDALQARGHFPPGLQRTPREHDACRLAAVQLMLARTLCDAGGLPQAQRSVLAPRVRSLAAWMAATQAERDEALEAPLRISSEAQLVLADMAAPGDRVAGDMNLREAAIEQLADGRAGGGRDRTLLFVVTSSLLRKMPSPGGVPAWSTGAAPLPAGARGGRQPPPLARAQPLVAAAAAATASAASDDADGGESSAGTGAGAAGAHPVQTFCDHLMANRLVGEAGGYGKPRVVDPLQDGRWVLFGAPRESSEAQALLLRPRSDLGAVMSFYADRELLSLAHNLFGDHTGEVRWADKASGGGTRNVRIMEEAALTNPHRQWLRMQLLPPAADEVNACRARVRLAGLCRVGIDANDSDKGIIKVSANGYAHTKAVQKVAWLLPLEPLATGQRDGSGGGGGDDNGGDGVDSGTGVDAPVTATGSCRKCCGQGEEVTTRVSARWQFPKDSTRSGIEVTAKCCGIHMSSACLTDDIRIRARSRFLKLEVAAGRSARGLNMNGSY